MSIEVVYLADQLHHIEELARLHDVEWGHLHPKIELPARVHRLREAAGRTEIPMVLLAVDDSGLVGFAALVKHDMRTRQDLSPWLAAVYVKPERRRTGVASSVALVPHRAQELFGPASFNLGPLGDGTRESI